MPSPRIVRFGDHRFDLDTGELHAPAGTVRLQPQPAKVLAILVGRPGELVTRDELKAAVWPDTVVEADQGLNFCVRQIRAALGDDAEGSRFIETLPRRGYRFAAAVESDLPAPVSAPAPPARRRGSPLGVAVMAIVVVAAMFAFRSFRGPAVEVGGPTRLAILPLATTDAAEPWMIAANRDYTERLVIALTAADSGRYGVVGPATTAPLANEPSHPAIGGRLGVDYVISGGIRASDSTLFIQAVRVPDGAHVFAWRQPVSGRDPAGITDEIVGRLGRNLPR